MIDYNHELIRLFNESLSSGLIRKTITQPSKWAENYRKMGQPFPGPWRFKYHPWLRGMHDSATDYNVGQKAAQMGFTECVLNIVFFYIDVHGLDCLYVLPAKTPDASDFSAARFDPAIDMSPHLEKLFSDVKNVGHKRAGNTNLYIRGSKSRAGLKSVPVGVLILDEKDEMNQENVPLARERQSGQVIKKTWEISTPTVDGWGINETFNQSTQEEFFFPCPHCSRQIQLKFPDNFEIVGEDINDISIHKSYIKCHKCNMKLDHETKHEWLASAEWVPAHKSRNIRGFHINQMYSPTVSPGTFIELYFKARVNPADEQEFYNSKLGLPHVVEGARVTDKDINQCIGSYGKFAENDSGLVTMGVDVGTWLHYEIDKWHIHPNAIDVNTESKCQLIAEGKVATFEELEDLMYRYQVQGCVIDIQPERRKAYEFAQKFWGRVRMCFYGRGIQGKNINIHSEDELTLTVDRTSWLDLSLGRFRNKMISLPVDLSMEYKEHIKSPVRVYEKDADGNPVGKYVKAGSSNDHLAHARTYSEIALPLTVSVGKSETIQSPV